MLDLARDGPFYKAQETLKVFLRRRPSVRALLASRHGEFDRVYAVLPSDAVVGDPVDLTVQTWDEYERLHAYEGTLRVESTDPDADHPDRIDFPPDHGGVVNREGIAFGTPGIQYLRFVDDATGRTWPSNPVRVSEPGDEPDRRVYWGDIHLHSQLSDGTGTIRKGMRFGRDVMDLDVVSYTDHDTMGFFIPPGLQRRRMHRDYFQRMKDVAAGFHEPGEFVTLMAYEWTKQPNRGGHVNVYFDGVGDATLYDSMAATSDSYEKLWARLREYNDAGGTQAVTVPHHPAESMYPFDFAATDYDDELAPLVEVYSQWGSSERPGRDGNRFPLEMGQGEIDEPGHYVQDALELGYRVGMIGGADYHGPHPGHSLIHAKPHLPGLDEWLSDGLGWGNVWRVWNERSYPGGLTAFHAPELTREAIFESLRERRVYATSQPHRILADLRVDGVGSDDGDGLGNGDGDGVGNGDGNGVVAIDEPDAERRIEVSVAGTAPLARVAVVKNNDVWRAIDGTDDHDAGMETYTLEREWVDSEPVSGMAWDDERGTDADVYYLRVRQAARDGEDPGLAWVGPLWVEA
jgi:hypothetical protein